MLGKCSITVAFLASVSAIGLTSASAQEAAAEDTVKVEDKITVTARKKAEYLEDVPSSVSALSEEDIDLLVLDGFNDFVRQIPGASLVSAGPEYLSEVSIRGQGGGRQGFSESATGIYRNGIYIAGGGYGGRAFSRLDTFDVASVETYRGPQGALYGRNAVGGAINVVSQRPTSEKSLEGSVGYESAERYSGELIANLPISDAVSSRFGVFYIDQQDGFVESEVFGRAIDQEEFFGARGQIFANLSATTAANLTVEYFDSTAPGFTTRGQMSRPRTVGPNTGDSEPGPFTSRDTRIGIAEIESSAIFAELDQEFDVGTLTAILSYKQRDGSRSNEDYDNFLGYQGINFGGVVTDLITEQTEDFERFGAEVRLASNEGSKYNWLVGFDYGSHTDDVRSPKSGTVGPFPPLLRIASRKDQFVEDLETYSAFGLIDLPVAEKTTLTLEARVQRDNKDFRFSREELGSVVLDTGDASDSWTRFLPAATLSYDLNDDQLVFLRAASGYRPGGFNTGIDNNQADFIPYDPETAYSAEAGWKGTFQNGVRFGISGYYMRTEDIQITSTLGLTVRTSALQNVGASDVYGLELEFGGNNEIGPGNLRWSANAATNSGEFSDDAMLTSANGAVIELIDLSGARPNRTRDLILTLNGFYFAPMNNEVDWFIGGSAQVESGGYRNAAGDTTSTLGKSLANYALFDGRVGLRGNNWQLSLYGQNIGEELFIRQSIAGLDYYNEPEKFGIELKFDFGG